MAVATIQIVGAAAPFEDVVAGIADQRVVVGRTAQPFDIHQRIVVGFAASSRARQQADGHASSGGLVAGGIEA